MARIAVVGAGPAGLACALTISEYNKEHHLEVFELGRRQRARLCPVDRGLPCQGCNGVCNVISGIGGSIHYGDSIKISGYPSGRRLFQHLGKQKYWELQAQALEFFGLEEKKLVLGTVNEFHGRHLRQYPIAELSELRTSEVIDRVEARVGKANNMIRHRCLVDALSKRSDGAFDVTYRRGMSTHVSTFDSVVLATGRAGFSSTTSLLHSLGIHGSMPSISLGIRLELPSTLLMPLYQAHVDFKFSEQHSGFKVKSFCFSNRADVGGRLKFCHYQKQFGREVIFLDGHSNVTDGGQYEKILDSGNFALMAQLPAEFGRGWLNDQFVEKYFEISGGKPIFQTLHSFLDSEGSPEIVPVPSVKDCREHSIAQLLPKDVTTALQSAVSAVVESIACSNNLSPNIVVQQGLVLAPEVEFFWPVIDVSKSFETQCDLLYIVGDAVGIAQGNLQAAITGIAAADNILEVL